MASGFPFPDGSGAATPPGLGSLRDIRGIEGVPWWPLADGWWMLIGALALLALLAWHWRAVLRLRLPIPYLTLGSWRWDAAAALRDLRRRARAGQDAKTIAGELSELLRRIAMARLGRGACAGLAGEDWLGWLAENDPRGFPWRERGRLLLVAPYAPPGGSAGGGLPELIEAAYVWVSAPLPRRPGPAARGLALKLRAWRGLLRMPRPWPPRLARPRIGSAEAGRLPPESGHV